MDWVKLFLIAAINDSVDLLGLANPLVELLLDAVTALILAKELWERDYIPFLIMVADAVPGVDLAPIWTLYTLLRYLKWREKLEKGA